MRVVVLVPRRRDCGDRDEVWRWVRSWWAEHHPEFEVFEGHHNGGRFNRSKAINAAAAKAGRFDVAIVADSDSFVGPEQIERALKLVAAGSGFVLPYDRFSYVSEEMSQRIRGGFRGAWEPGVEWTMRGTCSSVVVVDRRVWDLTGGFDEGFVGWGFEDVAFSHACQAFAPGVVRVEGAVWHLWHPASTENDGGSQWDANRRRMHLYEDAAYRDGAFTPNTMTALIQRLKETSR